MDYNLIIEIAKVLGAIGTIIASVTLIVKVIIPIIKKSRHLIKVIEEFLIDWSGEEERPGRDAVPGVMERLNVIDGALKNNGGSSLKDAVDRIERRVNRIDDRLAEGDQNFETIYGEIEVVKKLVERRHENKNIDFPDRRNKPENSLESTHISFSFNAKPLSTNDVDSTQQ